MDNLALTRGGSFALASGAIAAGTTTGTWKTTATIPYFIDGQFQTSKVATDNLPMTAPTGEGSFVSGIAGAGSYQLHAAGKVGLYACWLDAAGNTYVTQGRLVNTVDLANGVAPLEWPEAPRVFPDSGAPANVNASVPKVVCIGAIRVSLNTSTALPYNVGVDALTTAGNRTVTFYNLACAPSEPLRS